jgi:hypothetical protein
VIVRLIQSNSSVLFVILIAEVKHCHRNILMHLQRSHDLYMAEYEAKQPESDTEVKRRASEADTDTDGRY